MNKIALLIGVSRYQPGLTSLPSAEKDVKELEKLLRHENIGGFDRVSSIINPESQKMREEIENFFGSNSPEDLLLLYFSGHGLTDERGRLYFAANNTRKSPQADLTRSTTVEASFVQEMLNNSRSKRKVLILDCCYSGAFASGMPIKGEEKVNLEQFLGSEGSAIITSSSSTQFSFYKDKYTLSNFTHFLVQGLKTGLADLDEDGWINPEDLYSYIKEKLGLHEPLMSPQFFPTREGYKIHIARSVRYINKEVKKVIFLPSNFLEFDRLGLAFELKEIIKKLETIQPDKILFFRPKSDFFEDVKFEIHNQKPFFVHLTGVGASQKKVLVVNEKREEVSKETGVWQNYLKEISTLVECVFLNSCSSAREARKIACYINYVIFVDPNTKDLEANTFEKEFYYNYSQLLSIEEAFEKTLQYFPKLVARLFRKEDITQKVVQITKKKLRSRPQDPDILFSLCTNLYDLGQHQDALNYYDLAISLSSVGRRASLLRKKAKSLKNIGDLDQALDICNKVLKEEENPAALSLKSSILEDLGRFSEAYLSINKVLELEPNNYTAWHRRGRLLKAQGKLQEAIESLEKSLAIQPQHNNAEEDLRDIKKLAVTKAENTESLEKNINFESQNYQDWITQASVSEMLGHDKDAIFAYQKALDLNPDDISIMHQLGDLFTRSAQYEKTIETYKKILEKKPDNYMVKTQLGLAFRNAGQIHNALKAFKQALKINPSYRVAKYEQRLIYKERKP